VASRRHVTENVKSYAKPAQGIVQGTEGFSTL